MSRMWVRNACDRRGRKVRVLIEHGCIARSEAEAGPIGTAALEWDAEGCTLLPALHDHHIHIMATLAREYSLDLAGARDLDEVRCGIAAKRDGAAWLRMVGYDEAVAGLPDRAMLDQWAGVGPAKLQDRTGACWILNSAAVEALSGLPLPDGAERDAAGKPTGRFWREDAWLGQHLPRQELDPRAWSRKMAAYGVAGLTDAGAQNGREEAAIFARWRDSKALLQKLVVMGREDLPNHQAYARGPLKIHYDERDMPEFDQYVARIGAARAQGRCVAAHVVSEAELVLFIAALDAAGGAVAGDRIEHGSLIDTHQIAEIAARGLYVVSNPSFVHDRGDAYIRRYRADELPHLYRLKSLQDAGIALAAGSDAPYGHDDPWQGMRAARDRRTAHGQPLGLDERISADRALALFIGQALAPQRPICDMAVGDAADVMLCRGSMADILADLTAERVEACFADGSAIFSRAESASSLQ